MGGVIMAGGKLLFKAVSVAVMLWSSTVMAQYYGNPAKDQPAIYVNGEAEIRVIPDRAVITLGIETLDSSMVIAKKENDRILEAVISAIKKRGVEKSDIQTDYLNVEPKYDNHGKIFLGNSVRRRLVVNLKDISKFDNLISGVIEAGVSRILNIGFYTDELKKYREQARALAIKAASEKAQKLAAEIGQTAGKAISIGENRSYWRSWYGFWDHYGRPDRHLTTQVSVDAGSEEGDMPEAVGKISITAKVTASFLLE